jgi:hypothetical protein
VTTLNDFGPGSLREAISVADESRDTSSTITFDASLQGTITLQSALPPLAKNITITGAGWGNVAVVRNTTHDPFPIFQTSPGTSCEIDGLFIGYGVSTLGVGGGIQNRGSLYLDGCTVEYNEGGGIGSTATNGQLTLNACTVAYNSNTGVYGGGIQIQLGSATILNSEIYLNSAQDGGGISNAGGTLYISQSDVYSNTAADRGGGILNSASGTLTWVNGGRLSNNAAAGNGGGLYVDSGTTTLTSVTISSNQATGATSKGGGFYLNTGSLTLNSITISGNTAPTGPGGAWVTGSTLTINNPISIKDAIVQV